MSAFAHLPDAFRVLLPEIRTLTWAEESRADCSRCVMTPAASREPAHSLFTFHPEGRCCTYHPALANFLAGGALIQGGAATERVRERIGQGAGITPLGIRPPAAWSEHYAEVAAERFGRDLALRCPYWVGGDHACGIWRHRPATCRTWHCKHDEGLQGAAVWAQLKHVLAHIEWLLAGFCVAKGAPPPAEAPFTPDAWETWYTWCAGRVERASTAELESLADQALAQAQSDLVELKVRPPRALPDVVLPSVTELWREAAGVRVSGYSRYDTVMAPASIFLFLSRLDGRRTWQEAQAAVLAQGGEPISDHVVHELFRIGALEAPGATDATVIRRQPWPGLP